MIAGCSASVGTYDLVVMNCMGEEASAEVQVRRDGDSEAVLDETYAVPANSCDDLADGVQVEDVFPEDGAYEIRVEPEGRTPVTESVSVRQETVENNDESVNVEIGTDEVTVY